MTIVISDAPEVRWRERKMRELRAHLYETAIRLFLEHGYDGVTVAQIVREAGVSKGTFFNYFPSKEHVLAQYFANLTTDVFVRVRQATHRSPPEAIRSLHVALARRASAEPDLFEDVARRVLSSPKLQETETRLEGDLQQWQRDRVTEAIAGGDFVATLNADLFVGLVGAMLTATAHEWVLSRRGFDLTARVGARLDYLLRAAALTS